MLPASTIRELEELDRHLDNVHSGFAYTSTVKSKSNFVLMLFLMNFFMFFWIIFFLVLLEFCFYLYIIYFFFYIEVFSLY